MQANFDCYGILILSMDESFEQLNAAVFERYKAEGYEVSVRKSKSGVWQCNVSKDASPLLGIEINGWRKDLRTIFHAPLKPSRFTEIAQDYFYMSGKEGAQPQIDEGSARIIFGDEDTGRSVVYTPGLVESDPARIDFFIARGNLFAAAPQGPELMVEPEISRLTYALRKIDDKIAPVVINNAYELAKTELVALNPPPQA